MIKRAIVVDLGGFADHDAHAVIDEHAAPDGRPGVDLDPGQEPSPMRDPAREPAKTPTPQPVRHRAVPDQRVEARIAGEDLPSRAGGRIPLEHDGDVFTETREHDGIFAYPTVALKYWGGRFLDQAQIPTLCP